MRNLLLAWTVLTLCAGGLLADEPKLANAIELFPASPPSYRQAKRHYEFSMRLSPDAKRVLYSRPVAGSEMADRRSARYELVLRDLVGGKETILPIEPLDDDPCSILTGSNTFDPAGTRLALVNIKVETQQVDGRTTPSRKTVKWSIYDIAKGKMADTVVNGGRDGPAKFTADGRALFLTDSAGRGKRSTKIVSLADPAAQPKTLTAPGFLHSVSPAGNPERAQRNAGMAAFFVQQGPYPRPGPDGNIIWVESPPPGLVLWDVKNDKLLAEIPTNREHIRLDDYETQWTADGRYFYYVDLEEVATAGQPGRPAYRSVTRIWDVQEGKPSGSIPDAMPVGPGPGWSTMVLADRSPEKPGGFLLHDGASGRQYALGDSSKMLIHAHGGKVIYAEKADDSDAETVFVADIVVSPPAEKPGQPTTAPTSQPGLSAETQAATQPDSSGVAPSRLMELVEKARRIAQREQAMRNLREISEELSKYIDDGAESPPGSTQDLIALLEEMGWASTRPADSQPASTQPTTQPAGGK